MGWSNKKESDGWWSSHCNYSSARLRQFHMHLHNVYFEAYTYPSIRTCLPVQDWECENSWAINAVGMSLIILVRWKEGKKEGSFCHHDFSSTPILWTIVSFINVSSAVFSFFYVFHLLLLCFVFKDRFSDLQRCFLTIWLHRVFSLLALFSFLSPVL